MIQRLMDAWRVLRPRTVARTHKSVEDLRRDVRDLRKDVQEVASALKSLREQEKAAEARRLADFRAVRDDLASMSGVAAAQAQTLERLRSDLTRVQNRELQLRALAERDIELEPRLAALTAVMSDPQTLEYVRARVAQATVHDDPCPHAVIDDIMPAPLYEALVEGLPPAALFNDRPPNKRQLTVPFRMAPVYDRRVWSYFARTVVPDAFLPALVDKFRPWLTEWLRENFPALGDDPVGRLQMATSDGRILLRTRGYVIPPHRDPKWGFLTTLLYLARKGDKEEWGTQFYRVAGDRDARGAAPHWIPDSQCTEVRDVRFVPNRVLVFLNSTGAHGARIADTEPEGLERYCYQFRIGPPASQIAWLQDSLPAERRELWAGKIVTDY